MCPQLGHTGAGSCVKKHSSHCLTLTVVPSRFLTGLGSNVHTLSCEGSPNRCTLPTWSIIVARLPGLYLMHRIDCCMYSDSDLVGLNKIDVLQSGTSNPSPTKSTLHSILILPNLKSSIISARLFFWSIAVNMFCRYPSVFKIIYHHFAVVDSRTVAYSLLTI